MYDLELPLELGLPGNVQHDVAVDSGDTKHLFMIMFGIMNTNLSNTRMSWGCGIVHGVPVGVHTAVLVGLRKVTQGSVTGERGGG